MLLCLSTSLPAQKKDIPPGFEWIKKHNLLVSINEVSCADWLKYMAANDKDASTLPRPDDLVTACLYFRSASEVVLRDPKALFRDTAFVDEKGKKIRSTEKCATMPVTGISYEQATAYCEWLSDQYADSKFAGLKLNFRLPTTDEMDSLLSSVYSLYRKGEDGYVAFQNGVNGHGCAIYNHLHNSWCETNILMKQEFGYGIPMQAGVFFPDVNGLYDLMGNVAEMTNEKGIAKGGSCISAARDCQPGAINRYTRPEFWLGFRVVAEYKMDTK